MGQAVNILPFAQIVVNDFIDDKRDTELEYVKKIVEDLVKRYVSMKRFQVLSVIPTVQILQAVAKFFLTRNDRISCVGTLLGKTS